ncbi:MAG: UDP-N-acetylmuramoyl-L-alanine--D-glutamate ligase [Anaerolineae bacterium]|nr:UDP-N-acetylmuramoyl-L-alanine--D-glutamate ligase [Anaerolineae bacterium]
MRNTLPASVVILGLARQGVALARFFAGRGAHVTVSDRRSAEALTAEKQSLRDLPIRYVLGEHPFELLDDCELFCLSGGVPADLPIVKEAIRRGIPLSNDAQEFLRRCPAPVVGITGSAGKTTTTTLTGQILAADGFKTWVGGNIGNPLINEAAQMAPEHRVVMELSSFQLEIMVGPGAVSPQVAGVLNITPNHLDRHKTMEAYCAAKRNVVAHQSAKDVAVLGYDEPNARALSEATVAQVRYFSGYIEPSEGAFLRGESLVLRRDGREEIICRREDLHLPGFHNVLNVLAAITLSNAAGATVEAMQRAITTFNGVEHRLEEVRRWGGALWINDSMATAPERVLAALAAFDDPLILLAGGRDKDLMWEDFAQRVTERVRVLITFGEAADLIEGHVARAREKAGEVAQLQEIVAAGTLENAVAEAAQRVQPGDVVLLSPGGTSFDAFRDFAERGARFRDLVGQL